MLDATLDARLIDRGSLSPATERGRGGGDGGRMDGCGWTVDGWRMDGWTDGWMDDGWMDGRTDDGWICYLPWTPVIYCRSFKQ